MFLIIISIIVGLLMCMKIHKPFRFYCYSFFLPWLYDHPSISKLLGIRYENDTEWRTTRKESKVYIPGIIAQLLRIFIGMDFILEDHVRTAFQKLQIKHKHDINMETYFDRLENKKITLEEFEDFLSNIVLKETNRVFNIITEEQEKYLLIHVKELKKIVSALTISAWDGIRTAVLKFHHVVKMSLLLRTAPKETRILLIAPQLALIHNFAKMVINKNGDMSNIEPYDFLEPVSRFFVAETKCADGTTELVFVNRNFDKKNATNNRAFGPHGLQCPGAIFTFGTIRDVTKFLKNFSIKLDGIPLYTTGGRFKNITNKNEIFLTFKKIKEYAPEIENLHDDHEDEMNTLD